MKAIVIAGTRSGCGKTSVSLGLMAALARRSLRVQPFKAGPDFIDPGHHCLAAGRPSHNLDVWMTGAPCVRQLFGRACRFPEPADVAVVEGVMGLFDGFSGRSEAGSTAELAKVLGLPVLLVADARSMARSAAALVAGYAAFDPALELAGVLLNNVGSEGHRSILREAWETSPVPLPPLLGLAPRRADLEAPSRHLGLVQAEEVDKRVFEKLADWLEEALDVEALLASLPERWRESGEQPPMESRPQAATYSASSLAKRDPGTSRLRRAKPREEARPLSGPARARIGVALDEAFSFYYRENWRLLEEAGAELVFFSPLRDAALPEGASGLYFGGGYPELHADRLAANESMRRAVAGFARSGRPVMAECGGFMYLTESIEDAARHVHPMAGVFAARCRMEPRFQALGYREVRLADASPLGPAGTVLRGHEFHYSRLIEADVGASPLFFVSDRNGPRLAPEGCRRGAAIGSYVHIHFASNPEAARRFVEACAAAR